MLLLLALLLILGACTPKQESTADTTDGIASTAGTQTAPSTGTTGTTAPAETTQPTAPVQTTAPTQLPLPSVPPATVASTQPGGFIDDPGDYDDSEQTDATEVHKQTEPAGSTGTQGSVGQTEPTQPPVETVPPVHNVQANAPLTDFVIVANTANWSMAKNLATKIQSNYGVTLPVKHINNFAGNGAIYIGTQEYNSYGGYRYSITLDRDNVSVHVNGSGNALAEALTQLIDNGLSSSRNAYPFALQDSVTGYVWNTDNDKLTDMGMVLNSSVQRQLTSGVTMHSLSYNTPTLGDIHAYAVVVKANSNAKLMVAAAPWDAANSKNNPVKLFTTYEYANQLKDQGKNVLAICNGGFFKLNDGSHEGAGSKRPWGVQIIDGNVLQSPNTNNSAYTDNWFGVTYDGKYVISNTQGYSAYQGDIRYAIGGGLMLMENGKPCFKAADESYRTCVGITEEGDLMLLCMDKAYYGMAVRVFMDLNLDVYDILNLDGGGSTTLYTQNSGVLERNICGQSPSERPVADVLAIVAGS